MTDTELDTRSASPSAGPTGGNQFLAGPFAPITQEITAYDLPVTGRIPPELNGRLLRVGPNPIDPEDPTTYNWFTGSGMVHGVRLREGRAEWYRNRFVRDDQVVAKRALPSVPGPKQLGGGPRYVDTNVVNTHMFAHAGRTWAFAEAGVLPMELTYELETVARSNFSGTLNGAWTGHPHRDPVSGELHGMAYYWDWDHVSYHVLDTSGEISKTVDIPVAGRPVVHDMALTDRYAIFLDGPVSFSPAMMEKGYSFPYLWDFEYPTRWALVPRDGTADSAGSGVTWCEVDQTAVFHILNAFDLPDGRVALDGVSYEKLFVNDLTGPTESLSKLDRFIFDPATGRTTVQRLDDSAQEMPRMDERLTGRRHRYGYFSARGGGVSCLLKQDLDKGRCERFEYGPGRAGMEAVFVPCLGDSGEDDGWLMTYVSDLTTNTADVVILHSQDLAAGPVATIHLPQRVPIGFHGNWVPDEDIQDVPR
ncbi:MAG: carotenoid oxygenase [Streptosporangiales bacterium]|nr:carotenoid oxygenase [Streptosporangiales bacterium]